MKKTFMTLLLVAITITVSSVASSCSRSHPTQNDMLTTDATGLCPVCGKSVQGGLVLWDGHDSQGNPVSGQKYRAACKACGASLFAHEYSNPDKQEVKWQAVQTNEDSNKTN